MQCGEFRDALDQYLGDVLDESRRDSFRRHIRSCPECRSWALRVEPTMAFASVEPPPPNPDRVAACTASVMTQIRQQRLSRELRPRRGKWLPAAAAVLVAVLGGAGWWLVRENRASMPASAVEVRDPSGQESLPPRVQVNMSDEGVRVYQFADDEDSDTAMYYIVNPALES